jgi:hypothetical protein
MGKRKAYVKVEAAVILFKEAAVCNSWTDAQTKFESMIKFLIIINLHEINKKKPMQNDSNSLA